MTRPRFASYLTLLYTVGLLALLAVLAVLQYRWTGEASLAEQERMRQGLNESLEYFERSLDREISQVVVSYFGLPLSTAANLTDWQPALENLLADADHQWHASTSDPRLVSRILVAESIVDAPPRLYAFQGETSRLEGVEWPEDLARFRHMFAPNQVLPLEPAIQEGHARRHLPTDFIIDEVPALVHVLLNRIRRERPEAGTQTEGPRLYLVVCLDQDYLFKQRIPELAKRYLSRDTDSGYDYAITSRQNPALVLCSSPGADPHGIITSPDARANLLVLREWELETQQPSGQERRRRPPQDVYLRGPSPGGVPGGGGRVLQNPDVDRLAQERSVERRRHLQAAAETFASRGWQLFAKHRAGSLNAAVASTRLRNLGVSLGILLLLGVSLVVLAVSVRRAQRLSKQQMEFVAGISHELRTPIAVICSTAENLADGVITPNEQVRRYGQYILREGWRLDTLVEQTMEFAGIGSGIRRFHMEPLDLSCVLNDALDAFRAQIAEKKLQIDVSSVPGAQVNGDAPALSCAIGNLLSNGIKYSRPGGRIRVEIKVTPQSVVLDVTDQGIGIEAGEVRHLFEPFFRGSNARRAQIRGAGIGLSLVKRIAEAHQGRITVKSKIDEGSVFSLVLPSAANHKTAEKHGVA